MTKSAFRAHPISSASYQNDSGPHWWQPLNPALVDWRGRQVWLVGASSGIGRATAQALHHAGAQVAVTARDAAALQSFTEAHPGALALPLDVLDAAAVRAAAQALLARGPIDLVVYCAAHYQPLRATEFDLAQMRRHMDVNYTGALHLLDAVLPAMLAQRRGHISLVSSVAGYRGLPQGLAYGPTKAALTHLAETLWLDLRPQGIGVSVVSPGFVATPLTAGNAFPMPALIGADAAARQMLRGWARGRFEIHFPRRFTWVMKALRVLPFRIAQSAIRTMTGL